MKILIVHNRYQHKGGEDAVVLSEKNLLTSYGMDVELLEANNDAIVSLRSKLAASVSVFRSAHGVELLEKSMARFKPDIVHVHNWFPTLSPGVFWACKKRGIPVVQTLHNYRLLCANGMLFRDGGVCEDCVGTAFRTASVVHACYRGSRAGTAIVTAGMLTHWAAGTWHRAVDRFLALTEFARNKLIQGGLPEAKIVVKPNFLDYDPGLRPGNLGYFAFVGRLSEEKGILSLLQCWREDPHLPLLKMVGGGPLEAQVREAAASLKNVEWLGARSAGEVVDVMGGARGLLCPSLWYEGSPRVVIESLAVGTPVIAPRTGSYPEIITDGKSGVLYDAPSPNALHTCVKELAGSNVLAGMRVGARTEFETRYTAAINFKLLVQIYEEVIGRSPAALAGNTKSPSAGEG